LLLVKYQPNNDESVHLLEILDLHLRHVGLAAHQPLDSRWQLILRAMLKRLACWPVAETTGFRSDNGSLARLLSISPTDCKI
jgi:hypothetical protein